MFLEPKYAHGSVVADPSARETTRATNPEIFTVWAFTGKATTSPWVWLRPGQQGAFADPGMASCWNPDGTEVLDLAQTLTAEVASTTDPGD